MQSGVINRLKKKGLVTVSIPKNVIVNMEPMLNFNKRKLLTTSYKVKKVHTCNGIEAVEISQTLNGL